MVEAGFEPRYPASGTVLRLFPEPQEVENNVSIWQIFIDHVLYDRSVIGTEEIKVNKIDRVLFQRHVSQCETHTLSTWEILVWRDIA